MKDIDFDDEYAAWAWEEAQKKNEDDWYNDEE